MRDFASAQRRDARATISLDAAEAEGYRVALREESAHTVTSEAEVIEELRELRRILSR